MMVEPSLVLFYVASAITLGGALGVVMTRNIVYASFALLAAMMGVAGVFLLVFAEFLAESYMIYAACGARLREWIGEREEPVREAWERIYVVLRDSFGGVEYE